MDIKEVYKTSGIIIDFKKGNILGSPLKNILKKKNIAPFKNVKNAVNTKGIKKPCL